MKWNLLLDIIVGVYKSSLSMISGIADVPFPIKPVFCADKRFPDGPLSVIYDTALSVLQWRAYIGFIVPLIPRIWI